MNETVQNRVNRIEELAKQIISDAECILDDCKNFEGYDKLFTIESAFDRITRESQVGHDVTIHTYDELDEGDEI